MEDRTDEPGLPPPGWDAGAGAVGAGAAEAQAEAVAAGAAEAQAGGAEARAAAARAAAAGAAGAGAAEAVPVTGEPRVDAALARLDELPELPVTEHRAVFERVHRSLGEVLGELDTGSRRS